MPEQPKPMTVAEFYNAYVSRREWICEITRPAGSFFVKVIGAFLSGDRINITDKHGRTFWLPLSESIGVIER